MRAPVIPNGWPSAIAPPNGFSCSSAIHHSAWHGPTWAASDRTEDVEAADFYDLLLNRLFADPVLLGRYPDGIGELMPGDVESDLKIIGEPVDWYGINYYQPTKVGAPE